ncbi:MAG: alpha/beta hydrolase-fold protein [Candidatus Zixiibacteriota bacterium]
MWKQISSACLAIALIVGTLLGGCSSRENPTMVVDPLETSAFRAPIQFSSLRYNQVGDPASRIVTVYWASEVPPSQNQRPFPVLYLLHDFDGDGEYFGRYNLQGILEEMFEAGEIGRMLVVTVGAENSFGGSYYRNSVSSGDYADLIGETINFIEKVQFPGRVYTSQVGADARAIGGHGMGGYGAMRYAMEHPDQFSSVSSMSGPLSLDADWDGQPWLERWIDRAFAENGVIDSATYASMAPNDDSKPFTNRLFAMSAAFSPRDLDPFDKIDTCFKCQDIFCLRLRKIYPCSLFASVAPASYTFEFPPDPNGARGDSAVPELPANVGVDLPVLWTKSIVDSVWQMWLDNDVTTYLQANPGVFTGMELYIDCGVDDEFGYLYHNRDFRSALASAGYQENGDYIYDEYTGASNIPAGHADLIAERLRRILKFHSDRLARVPQ